MKRPIGRTWEIRQDEEGQANDDFRFLEYDEQKGTKYPARGVVTRRYKLLDYRIGTDAFYDLQTDPDEMHNRIDDPKYTAVVNVLRARLKQWQEQTKDPLLKK